MNATTHRRIYTHDIALEAGTYYIRCVRTGGYGCYTVLFGDPALPAAGNLRGRILSESGIALAEIDVNLLDRTAKTNFAGEFGFDALAPGYYSVHIASGAKYYPIDVQTGIQAGQDTVCNVTLKQTNVTPPADVEELYGFARDRYIHLFWSASASPDVPDGGGLPPLYQRPRSDRLGQYAPLLRRWFCEWHEFTHAG